MDNEGVPFSSNKSTVDLEPPTPTLNSEEKLANSQTDDYKDIPQKAEEGIGVSDNKSTFDDVEPPNSTLNLEEKLTSSQLDDCINIVNEPEEGVALSSNESNHEEKRPNLDMYLQVTLINSPTQVNIDGLKITDGEFSLSDNKCNILEEPPKLKLALELKFADSPVKTYTDNGKDSLVDSKDIISEDRFICLLKLVVKLANSKAEERENNKLIMNTLILMLREYALSVEEFESLISRKFKLYKQQLSVIREEINKCNECLSQVKVLIDQMIKESVEAQTEEQSANTKTVDNFILRTIEVRMKKNYAEQEYNTVKIRIRKIFANGHKIPSVLEDIRKKID